MLSYEGRRFSLVATLAGLIYGGPFGMDVGLGDPMYGIPDVLPGEDYLDFVGVAPVAVPVYPAETHVAEKLHAYTRPPKHPGRVNSRVRDLPDLALLASVRDFTMAALREALAVTFTFRATHPVPGEVPAPPVSWEGPYQSLAEEHDLPWQTLAEAYGAVQAFLGPVLVGRMGQW